jgi:phosphotransferase system enzyme I (PtsI)
MILNGKGVAPGITVGRIYIHDNNFRIPAESFVPEGGEQSELDNYFSVKNKALDELEKIRLSMQKHDPKKAEIFKAHMEIVDDAVINEEIPAKITNERWAGDWAIYQVYETVLVVLRQAANPLIAERTADFDDVRALLLRLWHGQENESLASLTDPVVIAAQELLPSDTACIEKNKVLAIITEKGGLTSHTAIIAKSYGIPSIFGINGLLDNVTHGQLAAVNADEGTVILDPDEKLIEEYNKKSGDLHREKIAVEVYLDREGAAADGIKIDIGLNINTASEPEMAAVEYVDSAGLFRTEFLYMGRDTLPSEDEQFSVYRKVLECFGSRSVILRTLDIGGDKQISGMDFPEEENPFLGNRALRFCFSRPDIFKTQIRAALRASVYGNLWLMFPLAGSLDDIRRAKEFIESVKEELEKEGKPSGDFKTGIMIEVPSMALIADLAAKEVDFASIGSNDLCQYLCAADRMNSDVESYYQSYHPALFRLIKETVSAFDIAGKPISICGELAADSLAVPLLVGLGLRKLSVGAASVAAVKRAVASVTVKRAEEIAAKVLEFSTAAEITDYLSDSSC